MLVLDAARRELLRTIEVLPGTHEPCPNCMFYLSTPVVDATTGLVYVAGRPPGLSEHPGASQDPDVPIGALGPAKAGVVQVGLAQGGRTPGGVPAGGGGGGTVYVVDPDAGEVLDTIDVPGSVVRSWAGDPAAGVVYLTVEMGPAPGVRALDTESLELGDPIPIEGQTPLAVDPNTGTVWVAGGGAVTIVE
jgi:hypothetical protein